MIDPFQIATNGVGPGFTTFNFATMGFGFDVEVIVAPIIPPGRETFGGTGSVPYVYTPQHYEIIVKIRYKGKEWEDRRTVTAFFGEAVIDVLAWYKSFTIAGIGINIKNIVINKITPIINVFKKNKD